MTAVMVYDTSIGGHMAKKNIMTKNISMEKEMIAVIQQMADDSNRSFGAMVRELLKDVVKK